MGGTAISKLPDFNLKITCCVDTRTTTTINIEEEEDQLDGGDEEEDDDENNEEGDGEVEADLLQSEKSPSLHRQCDSNCEISKNESSKSEKVAASSTNLYTS